MIQAIIFDLDGLLVESEMVWYRARSSLCREHGLVWTEQEQKKMMGVNTDTWSQYMTAKLKGKMTADEVIEAIVTRMENDYKSGEVPLMPGADEALRYCANNFTVGLASGSPLKLINAAISGAKWWPYFSQIVSSDEVDRGKPAPDVYLEAAKRLNIKPGDAIVVEDSEGGILAGKAAGAKVVAVPNSEMSPAASVIAKADIMINSLHFLDEAISKLTL